MLERMATAGPCLDLPYIGHVLVYLTFREFKCLTGSGGDGGGKNSKKKTSSNEGLRTDDDDITLVHDVRLLARPAFGGRERVSGNGDTWWGEGMTTWGR